MADATIIRNVPMISIPNRRIMIFPLKLKVTHVDMWNDGELYTHAIKDPVSFHSVIGVTVTTSGSYSAEGSRVLWGYPSLPHIGPHGGCLHLVKAPPKILSEGDYQQLLQKFTESLSRIQWDSLFTLPPEWPAELVKSLPKKLVDSDERDYEDFDDDVRGLFRRPKGEVTWNA